MKSKGTNARGLLKQTRGHLWHHKVPQLKYIDDDSACQVRSLATHPLITHIWWDQSPPSAENGWFSGDASVP